MAAGEDARNVPPKINLVCHPQTEYNHVSCLLCDSPYCRSDFVRKASKGRGFFLTNTSVICPEHGITYNAKHVQNREDDNFNQLQMLKLKAEVIKQEILNLTSQSAEDSVESEEESDNSSAGNTVYSVGMLLKEIKDAKKTIGELKRINEELIESNRFLRSGFDNKMPTMSYSSAAKVSSGFYRNQKSYSEVKTIIVTPDRSQTQEDTFSTVKSSLIATKKPVNRISKGKKSVIVKCGQKSGQEIKMALERDLGDKAKVEFAENLDPLIKIYGIDNEFSEEELVRDICERNNIREDSFRIEYIYPKRKNTKGIKLRVKADLYVKIAQQRSLHIGYQNCNLIYDDYNINQCNKCQGYNHKFSTCSKIQCSFCADEHKSEDCKNRNKIKCVNCVRANQFLTKKRSIDHEATDKNNCDTYKAKLNKVINTTNYPIEPAFYRVDKVNHRNG